MAWIGDVFFSKGVLWCLKDSSGFLGSIVFQRCSGCLVPSRLQKVCNESINKLGVFLV